MLIASKLLPAGAGLAPVLLRRAATLELDWDTRQKSRFDGVDSQGRSVAVFLPRGTSVRGGDVLVCEDGSLVAVTAKAQPVLVVSAAAHGAAHDLLRAAYHLGNRHVPLEVKPTHLQLEPDHVLAAMLRRMGLHVEETDAPFEPEAGAYDAANVGHAHDHAHADHAAQAHAQDHAHAGPAAHAHQHDHAEGDHDHCGHDHSHGNR